ncbi:protein BPS1, chloroplastic-like [Aristolochia californica]|uniref:protein BPS1, chloroplastic-like n=1 Tax=Aristolochia californica TaxID=171875 RepID=UPI0035D7FC0C
MLRTEASHFTPLSVFRSVGKKKSPSSRKAFSLLSRSFEDNLLRRLKTLNPPSFSFLWFSRAVHLLAETQADAVELIGNQLRVLPGSEKSQAWYLDGSVKVLDVCNSVFSDIENLMQGRLLVHFVIRVLEGSRFHSPEDLRRARECIVDCRECFVGRSEKRTRQANAAGLVCELTRGLDNPSSGKITSVEKVVRRTLYAVQAVTVFLLGVIVAVLEGLPNQVAAPVPKDCFLWAAEFNSLQSAVQGEIQRRLAGDKRLFLDEMEALEDSLRSVSDELVREDDGGVVAERARDAVRELERTTEELSDGLDRLLHEVNGFFRRVLSTRSVLLERIREE